MSTNDAAADASERLAAIVNSSEDAIIGKTLDGIVTSWNGAAEAVFGWTREEMVGQSILRLIPTDLQHEESMILAKLRAGERVERYETHRLTKAGDLLDISLTVSPVRDARGNVIGAAKIAHDITGRRRAERRLKEREVELERVAKEREQILQAERRARTDAERLSHIKDEFLATLSHELRTPLNAIQGWTAILMTTPRSESDTRALQTIDRNARAQGRIINDLLDMNRIVSGKIQLEVQTLNLHEMLAAAVSTVRQSATAKKIRIDTVLDPGVGQVRGDPNRLQQVLWNLLSNAVKFTPTDGRVSVVLKRVDSSVEISVEDTGIGIRADLLPFVFDRFRQGDSSTTRRYGGLGLGLSIVKSLVELHGGSVRVRSAGEDQGSTFVVALPMPHSLERDSDAQPLDLDSSATIELPRLDHIEICVVDDEQDGAILLARILEERGARVVTADTAVHALERLAVERFDVILSDVGMPEVDGYEMIRRLRAGQGRNHRVPAIAVTAYARPEDRRRALLAGFQMHIAKPIEAPELVAGVASLLHLQQP